VVAITGGGDSLGRMERHSMRKIREVLRLRESGLSQRAISASTGMSKGAVTDYLKRAREAALSWDAAAALSDAEVEARLFKAVGRNEPLRRAPIDMTWVHQEMRRAGVTLQLLWSEYVAAVNPEHGLAPYQYSQFCDLYATFRSKVDVSMRQLHRAGEKVFIDYSGKKPRVVDQHTGEVSEVELFVAVLGASNYTFAEVTRTQKLGDFIASTIRALEYFGGVPMVLVPDQLRSAVSGPHRYDPEINPTYAEFAQHYGVAVVPARPLKPKDKAKVENAVLVAQRWILACLRNRTFFSLDELSVAVSELLERLNDRGFKKLEGCRRSAFQELDRPALSPLPPTRYEVGMWTKAKVNIDYCVELDGRVYSVPCALVGARVDIRSTVAVVEILFEGKRVASHRRCHGRKGTATIVEEHRPKSHRQYGAWPPSRIVGWAASLGPSVAQLVELILADKPHPEQGYRSCMALFRDAKRYPNARVDAACARAIALGAPNRRSVQSILLRGLDQLPLDEPTPLRRAPHDNVRGADYFDRKENIA
jgi:transposase